MTNLLHSVRTPSLIAGFQPDGRLTWMKSTPSRSSYLPGKNPLCTAKHRKKAVGHKFRCPIENVVRSATNHFRFRTKAAGDKLLLPVDDSALSLITKKIPSCENFNTQVSLVAGMPSPEVPFPKDSGKVCNGNDVEERESLSQIQEINDYYEPKVFDEVIGVVVSGNDNKLDVDIGSKQLGSILVKDLCPLDISSPDILWNQPEGGAALSIAPIGQARVVDDEQGFNVSSHKVPVGSVLLMQIYALTMKGEPLLSVRRLASRVAWHRVRQIFQQGEPVEVQCLEWNPIGLVFKIEGLRAILPMNQSLNRLSNTFSEHVGERRNVLITDVDEATGTLLVSERQAWVWRNLRLGSLVQGTVSKVHKFGVELFFKGTRVRGMVHKSNISNEPVRDLYKLFSVGEAVKVIVVMSPVKGKTALCIAELESSKGLILQDKERVFREAEEMAARYRSSLSPGQSDETNVVLDIDCVGETTQFANEDWVDFGL